MAEDEPDLFPKAAPARGVYGDNHNLVRLAWWRDRRGREHPASKPSPMSSEPELPPPTAAAEAEPQTPPADDPPVETIKAVLEIMIDQSPYSTANWIVGKVGISSAQAFVLALQTYIAKAEKTTEASVPTAAPHAEDQLDALVESDTPPSTDALANLGPKKKPSSTKTTEPIPAPPKPLLLPLPQPAAPAKTARPTDAREVKVIQLSARREVENPLQEEARRAIQDAFEAANTDLLDALTDATRDIWNLRCALDAATGENRKLLNERARLNRLLEARTAKPAPTKPASARTGKKPPAKPAAAETAGEPPPRPRPGGPGGSAKP